MWKNDFSSKSEDKEGGFEAVTQKYSTGACKGIKRTSKNAFRIGNV